MTTETAPARRPVYVRVLRIAGVVLAVLLLAVLAIYVWPLRSDSLSARSVPALSYEQAQSRATAAVQRDTADATVTPDCRTQLLTHGKRTTKAVLLLHGYTDCPAQFDELAHRYYDAGYNVYLPRAPRQGVTDTKAHAGLHATELTGYADDALTVTTGLGEQVTVAGLSGGGVLATWVTEWRPDAVDHLLVLSPFYDPAASQAPAWQVKPLMVLYGFRVLPDHFNSHGFSYAALSQYLRIVRNFPEHPAKGKLASVAVVTSEGDTNIDLGEAVSVPRKLAGAAGLRAATFSIPASWNIGHDVVDPDGLGTHAAELEKDYIDLSEGRTVAAVN